MNLGPNISLLELDILTVYLNTFCIKDIRVSSKLPWSLLLFSSGTQRNNDPWKILREHEIYGGKHQKMRVTTVNYKSHGGY